MFLFTYNACGTGTGPDDGAGLFGAGEDEALPFIVVEPRPLPFTAGAPLAAVAVPPEVAVLSSPSFSVRARLGSAP